MSWHVMGVNDKDKRKLIKDVIKTQKADLVSLGNKIAGDDEWNCGGTIVWQGFVIVWECQQRAMRVRF